MTNESASRLQQALNTRIHLVFLDKFTARNLVNANLHLLLEPFVVREQLRHGFLYEFVRSATGLGGEGGKPGFLLCQCHRPCGRCWNGRYSAIAPGGWNSG